MPYDIPLLPSQLHLKSDNIRTVEVDRLQGEVLRLAVEHDDVTATRDWCIGRCNPIPSQLPCVDSPGYLHLLKDSKIHVFLRHSPQRRLKSAFPTVAVIV